MEFLSCCLNLGSLFLAGQRGVGGWGTARSAYISSYGAPVPLVEAPAFRSAAVLAAQTHACFTEPFVVGSAKRTVGAREKTFRRAGKAALIHFNASWDVAARSRTFYHQDAHGIASPVGDASLRIFRRASPAITHCFSFVSGCSAPNNAD